MHAFHVSVSVSVSVSVCLTHSRTRRQQQVNNSSGFNARRIAPSDLRNERREHTHTHTRQLGVA